MAVVLCKVSTTQPGPVSLFGSSVAGSLLCRIKGQGALHTRGLTSSFPVTENMRARPSGVHTVGTRVSHLPDLSFTISPIHNSIPSPSTLVPLAQKHFSFPPKP